MLSGYVGYRDGENIALTGSSSAIRAVYGLRIGLSLNYTKKSLIARGPIGTAHSLPVRLPEAKTGLCVSTVSIVGGSGGELPERTRADEFGATVVVADIIGRSG